VIVLVSDTSILIDLERGGLLEATFSCGFSFAVPDLLYQRELEQENGPYLRTLGLGVLSLSPEEMEFAQSLRIARQSLSLPDCFALSFSQRANHALVSSDKSLRNEAKARGLTVYGLLWLLDRMIESNNVPKNFVCDGLARIWAHARTRLPEDEVKARLASWQL
jgi:hypothetical protein